MKFRIYLNLYRDGVFDRIPAFVGESLLEALKRFTVDEVVGNNNKINKTI